MAKSEKGFYTNCVHAGNEIDKETGSIRRPLTMANSYRLPEDASTMNWSDPNQLIYTRTTSTNQIYLQEKLAALEGGEDGLLDRRLRQLLVLAERVIHLPPGRGALAHHLLEQ